jgi:alcohol dehydrogenase, propanol-preferring
MQAMVLTVPKKPLELLQLPIPKPAQNQILIQVYACAVCRTDLHIIDGELDKPKLPLVLGHQIVGYVHEIGSNIKKFHIGDRVGIPWLGNTCGHCRFCKTDRENLCDFPTYTGYNIDGGFAEYCVADEKFAFPISHFSTEAHVAPLLCGGLIGYRAMSMAENSKNLGFYGFGSAAHMLLQVAIHQGKKVYAFTRNKDIASQKFALELGAVWAGSSDWQPPVPLDAALIFAPVGDLVPKALQATDKGGVVICAGIHMSDIPSFPYSFLWQERMLRSVANLTRKDGEKLLKIAKEIPIRTNITTYALENLNQAINDVRNGKVHGTAVIKIKEEV